MTFNFLESGIKLFDDTFNTIKGLFAIAVENLTPTTLTNVGIGASSVNYYIRWWTSDTTYYTLNLQPNASSANNKAYLTYFDGTSDSRIFTFTVS